MNNYYLKVTILVDIESELPLDKAVAEFKSDVGYNLSMTDNITVTGVMLNNAEPVGGYENNCEPCAYCGSQKLDDNGYCTECDEDSFPL
jgi:hypothetical protein